MLTDSAIGSMTAMTLFREPAHLEDERLIANAKKVPSGTTVVAHP